MFNVFQRLQNTFNYILTLIIAIGVTVSVLGYAQLYLEGYQTISGNTLVNKSINTLKYSRNFGGRPNVGKENIKLNFELDTDLTSLFNWNTKQVFVYLVGEYAGLEEGENSKVVFWDKIISDKNDAVLNLSSLKSKYSVWDYQDSLANKTMNIKLEYNIQPWVGPLIWGSVGSDYIFTAPPVKTANS
ncbi:hypothetical protein CANARDRAFT_5881 [[Candida] arabinofermentans NRRL YB-2248]|uniref:Signal peptidase subunit 3 n=1 Tax=[Candida] arabinofermentans NRRL YB-2248 TaxID=983967 RepID=A0A1E4T6H6_9ASCO|nr:hypothetical protein CANARDRAFT_5881 [[Candida] arabinofermentans NRRL YB-2248]